MRKTQKEDFENLTNLNEQLKQVFHRSFVTKIEMLMNLNTRYFLHKSSACFKREGLDALSFLENKELFESERPSFEDPVKAINFQKLSMLNIPKLIELKKHKSIPFQSNFPFDLRNVSKNDAADLKSTFKTSQLTGLANCDGTESKTSNFTRDNKSQIAQYLFKNKVDDEETIKKIALCIRNEKNLYRFQQKRFQNYLSFFENDYKDCLRNCKFEIKNSFPKCCLFCQNYFYKMMSDLLENSIQ